MEIGAVLRFQRRSFLFEYRSQNERYSDLAQAVKTMAAGVNIPGTFLVYPLPYELEPWAKTPDQPND